MFAIGDKNWPGISKLVEEAGEVGQVAGKLIGTSGKVNHWDGSDLSKRLEEEMGDVIAAALFVAETCPEINATQVDQRTQDKLELFRCWHKEQSQMDRDTRLNYLLNLNAGGDRLKAEKD